MNKLPTYLKVNLTAGEVYAELLEIKRNSIVVRLPNNKVITRKAGRDYNPKDLPINL